VRRPIDGEKERQALTRLRKALPRNLHGRKPATRGERCLVLDLVEAAAREGARIAPAARMAGVSPRTLERWRGDRLHFLRAFDIAEGLLKLRGANQRQAGRRR
jgi:hypothetical protein